MQRVQQAATRWCLCLCLCCCVLSVRAADVLLLVVVAGAAQWAECVNTLTDKWSECVCCLCCCNTLICGSISRGCSGLSLSVPWGVVPFCLRRKVRCDLWERYNCFLYIHTIYACSGLSNYLRTICKKICLHILHKLSKITREQWWQIKLKMG